ncbi:MAG: hypothetical protein V4621_00205 [Pseudomonadota bacterium]
MSSKTLKPTEKKNDSIEDIDLLRAPVSDDQGDLSPRDAADTGSDSGSEEGTDTSAESDSAEKPLNLPEKFWDAKAGQVRLDALIKSYLHLEQKLSQSLPMPQGPEDKQRIYRLLGQPETADGYQIDCSHGLFDSDSELNQKLFALGFSAEQAQAVYDAAAEKLVPLILDVAGEFQADRELDRLVGHFGGVDKWREVSRQLLAFGRKSMPADVLKGLSSSYEGVLALYRMMTADGAGLSPNGGGAAAGLDEAGIKALMRDPKYWRDRDPSIVAKVAAAFEDMYGDVK